MILTATGINTIETCVIHQYVKEYPFPGESEDVSWKMFHVTLERTSEYGRRLKE